MPTKTEEQADPIVSHAFGQTRFGCPLEAKGGSPCTWNFTTAEELQTHMELSHR